MQIIANNIKNQIKVFDDTPVLSIEHISRFINSDTSELINIIIARKKKFKKLGFLRLINNKSICFLNERQIYLLFSYLKQTETLQELNQTILSTFVTYKRKKTYKATPRQFKEYFKIARIIIEDKNIQEIYYETM